MLITDNNQTQNILQRKQIGFNFVNDPKILKSLENKYNTVLILCDMSETRS